MPRWTLNIAALVAVVMFWVACPAYAADATAPAINPVLGPPPTQSGKIDVAVGMHISNIASIDEVAGEFDIVAYLFMRWNDPRLAYEPTAQSTQTQPRDVNPADIWMPKVMIVNAVGPRDKYDIETNVKPDGTVNYTERCKLKLSAKFELRRFPFDTQRLPILIHPFAGDAHLLTFSLNNHKLWLSSELNYYSSLAQWDLKAVTPTIGEYLFLDQTKVPEARFEIEVTRQSAFYLLKVFLPLILMVFLSWAAFWIETGDLQNQLQVGILTILTVIAFALAISSTMPRVPYLTYIDAFFLQCYVFVFLAIAELMTVHVSHRSNRRDRGVRIRSYSRWVVPMAFLISNVYLAVHYLG
ncbi:MAG TPA: hypothetical protein VMU16_02485 [Candidatus Binataceae bacterium]|nr:hypothetical protein [Candidatus Binataceae bacterium]